MAGQRPRLSVKPSGVASQTQWVADMRRHIYAVPDYAPSPERGKSPDKEPTGSTRILPIVTLTDMQKQQASTPSAHLIYGTVVTIGFDPGREFIELNTGNHTARLTCTASQSDDAVALRHSTVECVYASEDNGTVRVLLMRSRSDNRRMSDDEIDSHIHATWGGLFKRLAK